MPIAALVSIEVIVLIENVMMSHQWIKLFQGSGRCQSGD